MKNMFLLFFLVLFLVSCRKDPTPEKYEKESELEIRMGVNGSSSFKNIMLENAKIVEEDTCYTKYGYGEISFNANGKILTYAIFSIPADERDVETYFNFEVEEENADLHYRNYVVCAYDKESSKNVKFSLCDNNFINVPTNIKNKKNKYLIKVSGEFGKYKQENLIVIGSDFEYNGETRDINDLIDNIENDEKILVKENTAYIVAYPWRNIKVRIEGGDTVSNARIVKWANDSIFNQAICRLKLTTDTINYDCKIILSDEINSEFIIYDEDDKEYKRFSSARAAYAKVDPNNDLYKRNFACAVAILLGMSLFEDDSDKTSGYNLMYDEPADYEEKAKRTHLSFRQWNQLHIREKN
ncbi:MAG: hypothetical protein LBH98_06725 [Chitinispirillales bacterium]|jgi:hypothetical protein|nr:hypothetical protein [Chitinispirillales bacterium]